MQYYDMIDISEGIDVNKTSKSKDYDIFQFFNLLMMSMNLSNIDVLKVKNAANRCVIRGVSKSEAINLMENIDLTEKEWNII